MNNNLEQEFDKILAAAEGSEQKQIEPKQEKAEEEKNNEEEGVNNAAETSNEETESNDEEGQQPSEDLDEEFKNLDPELKEILLKADAETRKAQANAFKKMRATVDKRLTELGQEKKIAETSKQIFSKYGIDPMIGLSRVENLIEFEKELEKNPQRIITALKAKFNIADEKSGSDKHDIDESLLTEEEKIIYNKQKDIEKTVESLVKENQRLKQEYEQREVEKIQAEIIAFKEEKAADGTFKHPYFDDLIIDIEKLSNIYPNDNIAKLYNRALRLNDEVYNKSLEDAKKKERDRINAEKQAALTKAKNINSQSLKASKTSEHKSLDDILLGILEQAGN